LRIFVDECVDWRLARDIVGHEVKTAREMGWTTLKTGELLALASKQFEVFVTVDRNLSFQQNLPAFEIAVVVLRSRSNRLGDLQRLVPEPLASLATAQSGVVTYVGSNSG
jgi:predicted nuclease of predicted toxin-antitoxin system